MIEIINMHTCKDFGTKEGDIRVDRKTKWGNPFAIGVLNRAEVCECYEGWVADKLHSGALDIRELIKAKRLGCWCAPRQCHAETLRRLIENELLK